MPSLFHSSMTKGRAQPWPTSREAGGAVRQVFKHTFDAAGANADIVELGVLPARHRLIGLRLINPNGLTITNMGILTGVAGQETVGGVARAMSSAVSAGRPTITAAAAATSPPTKSEFDKTVVDLGTLADRASGIVAADALVTNDPVEYDRGVGVTLGGTASVGNVLWIVLEYAQGI